MDESDGLSELNLYVAEVIIEQVRRYEKKLRETLAGKIEWRLLSHTRMSREDVNSVIDILVDELKSLETFKREPND